MQMDEAISLTPSYTQPEPTQTSHFASNEPTHSEGHLSDVSRQREPSDSEGDLHSPNEAERVERSAEAASLEAERTPQERMEAFGSESIAADDAAKVLQSHARMRRAKKEGAMWQRPRAEALQAAAMMQLGSVEETTNWWRCHRVRSEKICGEGRRVWRRWHWRSQQSGRHK